MGGGGLEFVEASVGGREEGDPDRGEEEEGGG